MQRGRRGAKLLERLQADLQAPLEELDLEELGRHNRAYTRLYGPDRFASFVRTEWPYYIRVLDLYRRHVPTGSQVLDVGTFIPVMPLLLSWSGYDVTTVEKLSIYGDALSPMLTVLERNGVRFENIDIVASAGMLSGFDAVNLLAVIEHLLGSPKQLLVTLAQSLKPDGMLFVVVPNQARLIRRLSFALTGISVQPDYQLYFESGYPFEGHHREYTMSELRYAVSNGGYDILELGSIRYPPKGGIANRVVTLAGNLLPATFHQVLYAVGQPSAP